MTDHTDYIVVISESGRHAIWPAQRSLPWGWSLEGVTGTRADCLRHIKTIWHDLDGPTPDRGA